MYKIPLYFIKKIINTLTSVEEALSIELKIEQKLTLLKRVQKINNTLKSFIGTNEK